MSNQAKGLAALLAAHGRNGDTELVHATKGEVRGLNAMAKKHFGRELPRNPNTGLREASLFRQWFGNDVGMAADIAVPTLAGAALTATGAGAPLGAALLGGAIGAANQGLAKDSTATSAGLGAITGAMGGYGGGGLGEGLASAGSAAPPPVTTPPVTTPPVGEMGLGSAGGFSTPPANVFAGGEQAFGSFGNANVGAPNSFVSGVQEGANLYNTGAPAVATPPTATPSAPAVNPLTGNPNPVGTPDSLLQYHDVAQVDANTGITTLPNGSQVPNAPPTGTPVDIPKYDTKMDYLMSDEASKPLSKVGASAIGTLMIPQGGSDTTETTGDTVDRSLPATEVYYTAEGERRTRAVDRPRYGNVNMAEGGLTFSDYDAADAGADGGYAPGGLAAYAGGGLMGTGWGEQNKGGFAGLTSSLQPGGAVGDWHGKVYGALGADQVMPGGAGGSLIPGANQFNAKKREEEERKRREQEEGIAAAAAAKTKADQKAAFENQWSDRYGAPVAMAANGGLTQHFEKGGKSELDVTDLEHPAARYLRRAEAGGSPIIDKNVRGAAGRVGYNFPVGETGNFNAGVSGYGMRAHAPGTDPVTRGQLTGVDFAYSPSQDRTISARYDAMAPASMPSYGGGYSAADFGGRPSEAQMMGAGMAPMARDRFSVNYRQNFAEGGISALGHYSDGGQLLRGPGDGVSDNIPASIEGKRPARLADGEFVVPARAVSELGNGSTEAGSKQLYAMLDRIAKKRKSGKGLAYQANPKKILPA